MTDEGGKLTVEDEFALSWDEWEKWYTYLTLHSSRWQYLTLVVDLMTQLREQGYHRQFRAGQSLVTFILSRSLKHGLRSYQARLEIDIYPDASMDVRYYDRHNVPDVWDQEPSEADLKLHTEKVELTPEFEALTSPTAGTSSRLKYQQPGGRAEACPYEVRIMGRYRG